MVDTSNWIVDYDSGQVDPTQTEPPVLPPLSLVLIGDPSTGPYSVNAILRVPADHVTFYVDGAPHHTEYQSPYSLFDQGPGDIPILSQLGTPGVHVIQVIAYGDSGSTIVAAEASMPITEGIPADTTPPTFGSPETFRSPSG